MIATRTKENILNMTQLSGQASNGKPFPRAMNVAIVATRVNPTIAEKETLSFIIGKIEQAVNIEYHLDTSIGFEQQILRIADNLEISDEDAFRCLFRTLRSAVKDRSIDFDVIAAQILKEQKDTNPTA
jgi:hypothetical protein